MYRLKAKGKTNTVFISHFSAHESSFNSISPLFRISVTSRESVSELIFLAWVMFQPVACCFREQTQRSWLTFQQTESLSVSSLVVLQNNTPRLQAFPLTSSICSSCIYCWDAFLTLFPQLYIYYLQKVVSMKVVEDRDRVPIQGVKGNSCKEGGN